MENGPRGNWSFFGQNPTNSLPPSSATANGGTFETGSSSSMPPVNHNNGFLFNHRGLPFQNLQQQQLPVPAPAEMGSHLGAGVNPVRSVLNYRDRYPSQLLPEFNECYPDEYDEYYGGDYHPFYSAYGFRSPRTGFPEIPYDRNLEIDFNRLNITAPNHHTVSPYLPSPSSTLPPSNIGRNNPYVNTELRVPPVNRNTGCNGPCCNPHLNESFLIENSVRSRDWNIRDYQYSQNPSSYYNPSPRQQGRRLSRFPASLRNLRGMIYMVAKDHEGCLYLQSKCDMNDPKEIELIFHEIKDHIRELMVDASMNYLAQKLFKVFDERQLTHIVLSVVSDHGNFTSICQNSHGTRAMQRLIEFLTTPEQRSLIVSALRRITVTLLKNTNGHHVIQNCLKSFPVHECQPILDVVADNCIEIATDKCGCCVLQLCSTLAVGRTKDRIVTPIIENSLHLCEHQFGNYVVQHILGMEIQQIIAEMVKRLSGNFVSLSMNKFASNVVEKFFKFASYELIIIIHKEFINSSNFLTMITHPYGNYVVQSALNTARDAIKETMIHKIQKEYASLHSHPHGKRVLALARSSKMRMPAHHHRRA